METVRFITKFEDFANDPVPYMYHCHMLTHEDGGMMGQFSVVSTTDVNDNISAPQNFELSQNYPNPFNPSTVINYSIVVVNKNFSSLQNVILKVFDILGREVATLVNKTQAAGNYQVTFDATSLPTGMYIYKLFAGNFVQSRKMMLVK